MSRRPWWEEMPPYLLEFVMALGVFIGVGLAGAADAFPWPYAEVVLAFAVLWPAGLFGFRLIQALSRRPDSEPNEEE